MRSTIAIEYKCSPTSPLTDHIVLCMHSTIIILLLLAMLLLIIITFPEAMKIILSCYVSTATNF